MKRVVIVTWLALILGLGTHPKAQSAAEPRFEVASVKPSDPNAAGPSGRAPLPTTMPIVGGRFVTVNNTLRDLVKNAYDFWFDFRLVDGPDWQRSRRFDIQAKAENPAADMTAMRPMLRALLADRFKLKVHAETREMPIFALVVARSDRRLGQNLKPSTADCSEAAQALFAEAMRQEGPAALTTRMRTGQVPCSITPMPARAADSMEWRGNGASMAAFADFLSTRTDRVVQDRTNLRGLYDWQMTFNRNLLQPAAPPAVNNDPLSTPPSETPLLTTALLEQLGLKLEATRGPVEVFVIDSAVLPDPD